ncbi:hypothetical protein ACHAW5_004805, partial [Stephanodiscus triporus]
GSLCRNPRIRFQGFYSSPNASEPLLIKCFEHPSEVQHECIPQAVLGMDIVCQAKSGMGKTAVFVLATLHQLILNVFLRGKSGKVLKYLPEVKTAVFYGGVAIKTNRMCSRTIVLTSWWVLRTRVGTSEEKDLKLDHIKHFVLDECDRILSLWICVVTSRKSSA